jgi:peptidoglycan/xylan/chitin deacetylase (PgdA/CDA1 family)
MMERKPIIFTVDVEGVTGKNAVDKMIYGKLEDGNEYGIPLLIDLLDKYNIKGIFFVDIAEAWDYGEEKIVDVLRYIKGRNHDVGVHIHPDHMKDTNKRFLWQYDEDEQREMITKCSEFYQKAIGEKPIAFRAGRYGLNNTTLDILDELGYKLDFSEFYGKKNCKISPHITCNKITRYKNIIEVPVTTYKSFGFGKYFRFDKIDVSMRLSEFKYIMDKIQGDSSVDIISMFAHSFSFLTWRKHPDNPKFNKKEFAKITKMIDFTIKNANQYEYYSVNQVLQKYSNSSKGEILITDYSKGIRPIAYFIDRAIKVAKARLENNI